MRTLPIALPSCGEPATVRIEIYSTGSLDASAYTCPTHTEAAVAAVERADLTAAVVDLAPDIARPCGHVHVYPTGRLAGPARPPHPHWCDRRDCAGRAEHRSVPVTANPTGRELQDVRVTLVQLPTPGAPTSIEVAFTDSPGEASTQLLDIGQATALTYGIRRLVSLARTGRWF